MDRWTSFERANAELIKPADWGNAWPQVIDVGMPPTAFSRFVPSARWLCGLVETPRWWLSCFSGSRIELLYLGAKGLRGHREARKDKEEMFLKMLEGAPSYAQRACHAIASIVNAALPGYYMLSHRVAPASPRAFYEGGRYSAEAGVSFTNGSDVTVVATLFETTTKAIYSSVRTLSYAGMGWTDGDLDQLLDVLTYTDAGVPRGTLCARLQELNLASNRFTSRGADRLARHLDEGMLPNLEVLRFEMNDVAHPRALYEACQRRGITTNWKASAVWRLLYRVSKVCALIVLCWLLMFFILVASNDHDPHGVLPAGTSSQVNLIILAYLLSWLLWFSVAYAFFRAEGPLKAHWGRLPTVIFFPLMAGVLAAMAYFLSAIFKWVASLVIDALNASPPTPPTPGMWPPAPPTLPAPPLLDLPTPDAGAGKMAIYYLLILLPAVGLAAPFVTFLLNVMLCKPSSAWTRNVVPIHTEL